MLQVVLEVVAQYGDLLCYSQPKHQRHNRILLRWMWMSLVEMHTRDKEVVLAAVASSCWAVKYVTLAELARKLTQLCSHLFRTTREQLQWSAQRSFFAIVGDVFDRKTEPSRPFPIERLHFTTRPRYKRHPTHSPFFLHPAWLCRLGCARTSRGWQLCSWDDSSQCHGPADAPGVTLGEILLVESWAKILQRFLHLIPYF